MQKNLGIVCTCVIFLVFCFYCQAEVIILKPGAISEAPIIERADDSVRVNVNGVEVRYYLDENQEIKEAEKILIEDLIESLPAAPQDPKEIFAQNSPAIVCIYYQPRFGQEAFGSGFIVDPAGIIITNYHVVFPDPYSETRPQEITVRRIDGQTYPLQDIIFYDQNLDI